MPGEILYSKKAIDKLKSLSHKRYQSAYEFPESPQIFRPESRFHNRESERLFNQPAWRWMEKPG